MLLPPPPRSFGAFAGAVSGNQAANTPPVKLDEFQKAVVQCNDKTIVAEAFAGAGKTTMAIGYAAARPDARVLYLCFGKANQVEAARRFGANTECRTGHSLAYGAVGHKFNVSFKWKARELAGEVKTLDLRTAGIVIDVLNQFFSSTQLAPNVNNILDVQDKWSLAPNEFEPLIAQAKFVWSRMQIPGSGLSMPPDGYLKVWALTRPSLSRYTHIVLDEGQDTNPVMAELVQRQSHAHKLIIGDRHQSIFLFRGAANAMEQFSAAGATVLKMPRTWRFGPDIAAKANAILSFFKAEQTQIIGAGPGTVRRPQKARAVLARTNAGVLEEAAAVLGKNTHWLGGIENYRIDSMMESHLLKTGRRSEIRDSMLRGFESWSQYVDEASRSKDSEARMLIQINEKYGKDIPFLVQCFRKNALPTESGALLVLSTIHKAKGLDFDSVTIADDFDVTGKALDELRLMPSEPLTPVMAQEINLLYVAITRAKHVLNLNRVTKEFMVKLPVYRHEIRELQARFAPQAGSEVELLVDAPRGV